MLIKMKYRYDDISKESMKENLAGFLYNPSVTGSFDEFKEEYVEIIMLNFLLAQFISYQDEMNIDPILPGDIVGIKKNDIASFFFCCSNGWDRIQYKEFNRK